jgi:hypothetical protein
MDHNHNVSSPTSRTPSTLPRKRPSHTTSEEPLQKRKVTRACDICKGKKAKCSGTQPCASCARRGLACLYEAQYLRGRPPTPVRNEPHHGRAEDERRHVVGATQRQSSLEEPLFSEDCTCPRMGNYHGSRSSNQSVHLVHQSSCPRGPEQQHADEARERPLQISTAR